MELKNMKMSADEQREYGPTTLAPDRPEYPYGLRLNLDDDGLAKLGLTDLPEPGTVMHIMAHCTVVRRSESSDEQGKDKNLELQITDMAVGMASGMTDDERLGKKVYDGAN